MQLLTANFDASLRREQFGGRQYLVRPVVLLVPGVLNGSGGPLYYPPEETQKSAADWNGVPILLEHPVVNGQPSRANGNIDVLLRQGLGVLRNTAYDGRVKGEAWLDEEALERIDRQLLAAVLNGHKIEVSTGLEVDVEEHHGTVSGRSFRGIARNYRPDHLAVLLSGFGACSVKDGCGLSVNQRNSNTVTTNLRQKESTMDAKEKKVVVDFIVANCGYCDEADRAAIDELPEEKLVAWREDIENASKREKSLTDATKEFTDPAGTRHAWNAEKAAWESEPKRELKKEEKTVSNKDVKPALTPEQEEDLAFARQVRQERRDEAIASIVANEGNKLTAEQMQAMPLDVLQSVAASLPRKPDRRASYEGAAGAAVTNQDADESRFADFGLPQEYLDLSAVKK